MPQTRLVFYREVDGSVPVKKWLIDRVIGRRNALEDDPEKHIDEEHRGGEDPQDG